MKDRLSDSEIQVLTTLERYPGLTDAELIKQVSDRLYRHGLVAVDAVEGLQITGRGKHLLFQRRCINFLRSIQDGGGVIFDPDAIKWLEKNGFIKMREGADTFAPSYVATNRANTWLEALELA